MYSEKAWKEAKLFQVETNSRKRFCKSKSRIDPSNSLTFQFSHLYMSPVLSFLLLNTDC